MYVSEITAAPVAAARKALIENGYDIPKNATKDDIVEVVSKHATKTGWVRMSHANCSHPSTPKARAACRAAHGHKSAKSETPAE